jgi:hypothetical protein
MAGILCAWSLRLLTIAYFLALAIGLIGTFGWFGQERDPRSWVFVILLGQPWVFWIGHVPEPIGPWLAALCPLLNLFLIAALCRALSARWEKSRLPRPAVEPSIEAETWFLRVS